MGMQDVLMKFVLKEFASELNRPGSALNKKYKSELGKLFNGGLDANGLDVGDMLSGVVKGDGPTLEERRQFYDDNRRRTRDVVLDNALSGAGDLAEGAGDIINIYNSLLGDALLAVSQGIGSQGYDNPLSMMPAAALAHKARGGAARVAGGTLNKIMKNIVNDRRGTEEMNRNLKTLNELDPPGAYYDAQGRSMKAGGQYGRK